MDALTLVFQLLLRSAILLLPVAVAMLAFRRLAMSESANAWLYAGMAMIACITAAGLAPWAVGSATGHWIFFLLAPLCPALWLGVVIICDLERSHLYDSAPSAPRHDTRRTTLILENPEWPQAPVPVFRHRGGEPRKHSEQTPVFVASSRSSHGNIQPEPAPTVLDIARSMRGNVSSQHRREPRQLPAPGAPGTAQIAENLPFLKPYPQT